MKHRIFWLTPDRFDLKPDKSTWIEMTRALIDYGHDVTILTSKSKSRETRPTDYDKFTHYVKALDLPLIFRFSVLLNMFLWLKKHATAADIIIINQDALWLAPVLKLIGIRKIHLDIRTLPVDTHTAKDRLDKFLFWHLPMKFLIRSALGYSFITGRLKQELDRQFNLHINEFAIWQSGVSTDIFYPKSSNTNLHPGKFRLFYHGTVSINRGIGLVIEALALIKKEISLEFIIIGTGSGLEELKTLANKLSLNDRVNFRGFLPYENMAEEISQADICVCPLTDRLEWNVSSPIKVFEYMACGKPLILTPIPAHKDVVGESPFVVWTHGYTPEDFQQAILEAIEKQDSLSSAAASAPLLVKTNYEWRSQAKKLDDYLSKVFSEM